MNILFFTYDFPYPTNSGGKTRAYNLIKYAKKDNTIILFSFTRGRFHESHKTGLADIGVDTIVTFPRRGVFDIRNLSSLIGSRSLFYSLYFDEEVWKKMFTIIKRERIDLVHTESFYTGYYLNHELTMNGIKQVFGTENIESKLYEAYAKHHKSQFLKRFFANQAKRIKKEEALFYNLADSVLTVTPQEAELVRSATSTPCFVVENGVSESMFLTKREHKEKERRRLLFIGNFTYFPNVDAMQYFISSIFHELPKDVTLTVVGKNADKISFLRHQRIETIPFVTNISDAYKNADILISPVRIGGGTNFKILEAMASGLPVVALEDRVKDIGLKDKKEIMIAKDSSEFIKKIEMLKNNTKMYISIAQNAQRIVEQKYAWEKIGQKLHDVWHKTLHEKN